MPDQLGHKDPNVANARRTKRVAIVISNPTVSGQTGWPIGFWWSELAHPSHAFTDVGYETPSPTSGTRWRSSARMAENVRVMR
jgi:hypothetical protein